jgi:hypothetical protein
MHSVKKDISHMGRFPPQDHLSPAKARSADAAEGSSVSSAGSSFPSAFSTQQMPWCSLQWLLPRAAALRQPTMLHLRPPKVHPTSQIMTINSNPVIIIFFIPTSFCFFSMVQDSHTDYPFLRTMENKLTTFLCSLRPMMI